MPDDRADHSPERRRQITQLLQLDANGQSQRAAELLPLVYEELRGLARAQMNREAPGQTLQATALVHEAFLRVIGTTDPGWSNRAHFFGAAAQAMRRILVEQARRRGRIKHGGDRERLEFDEACAAIEAPIDNVLDVDAALRKLEARDERKGRIVALRYFAGLTAQETAGALGVSLGTIEREWRFIKAWLREELDSENPTP